MWDFVVGKGALALWPRFSFPHLPTPAHGFGKRAGEFWWSTYSAFPCFYPLPTTFFSISKTSKIPVCKDFCCLPFFWPKMSSVSQLFRRQMDLQLREKKPPKDTWNGNIAVDVCSCGLTLTVPVAPAPLAGKEPHQVHSKVCISSSWNCISVCISPPGFSL